MTTLAAIDAGWDALLEAYVEAELRAWGDRVRRLAERLLGAFGDHGPEARARAWNRAETLVPLPDGSRLLGDSELRVVPEAPIPLRDDEIVIIEAPPLPRAVRGNQTAHRLPASRAFVGARRAGAPARSFLAQPLPAVSPSTETCTNGGRLHQRSSAMVIVFSAGSNERQPSLTYGVRNSERPAPKALVALDPYRFRARDGP